VTPAADTSDRDDAAVEANGEETAPMPLPRVGSDPECHDPVDRAGEHGAWLVVVAGGAVSGERFRVLATTTVGRSPNSDVFLDDVTVSREHAGVRIEDRQSLNGTYVNGERVDRSDLSDGDALQVGKFKLSYVEE
jgi:hypothetical protein